MKYSSIKDFAEAMRNNQLPITAIVSIDNNSVYIYERDFDSEKSEPPEVLYKESVDAKYFLINLLQEFNIEEIL